MSIGSTNTYHFGQMELALPQNWDVAFFKKPLGNKGLKEGCGVAEPLERCKI